MKKNEEAVWQKIIWIILMILLTVLIIGVAAYFYGKSFRDIFMLLLIVAVALGAVLFSLLQSNIFGTLHYDNGGHYRRFVLAFIVSAIVCCALPLLPNDGWAVPPFALALTLFSNTVTGLLSYSLLLGVCVYFSAADMLIFLLYFLMGCLFAVLFERLDEAYRTGAPMSIATMVYAVGVIGKAVFENHGALTADFFIMPIINIFISFILMLAVLRFYCASVVDKEKEGYLLINDQEYKLLAKYKQEDRQLYYNAIHTAYFAEKTARLLHMDVDLAKNGGYYHRIIVSECKKQGKTLEQICEKHKFPPQAIRLLQEYNYKSQNMKLRETVAVYLADSVVSSIMYLLGKEDGKKEDTDYGQIAIAIVRRKIDSGSLNDSDISLSDIGGMEKIYTGEKLYYDFLRGE